MRKVLQIGGFVAALILVAFGITTVVLGANGRSTVASSLKAEHIVGSADMTPAGIKQEAQQQGVAQFVSDWPTKSVANKNIDSGSLAREFAMYMRIHALESSGGLTYAQMPRYATADGKGTNNAIAASKSANGQPLDNPKRNIWITETALTTALNMSYMADQLGLFSIVVGVALLLTGIGLAILAVGGTLANAEPAVNLFGKRTPKAAGSKPIPAA